MAVYRLKGLAACICLKTSFNCRKACNNWGRILPDFHWPAAVDQFSAAVWSFTDYSLNCFSIHNILNFIWLVLAYPAYRLHAAWHSSQCKTMLHNGRLPQVPTHLLETIKPLMYGQLCWDWNEGMEGAEGWICLLLPPHAVSCLKPRVCYVWHMLVLLVGKNTVISNACISACHCISDETKTQ